MMSSPFVHVYYLTYLMRLVKHPDSCLVVSVNEPNGRDETIEEEEVVTTASIDILRTHFLLLCEGSQEGGEGLLNIFFIFLLLSLFVLLILILVVNGSLMRFVHVDRDIELELLLLLFKIGKIIILPIC